MGGLVLGGSWFELVLVFAGGLVGGAVRAVLDQVLPARQAGNVPAGILVANLAGSLILGLLVGLAPPNSTAALVVGTGGCGALTTFSTFSLHLIELARVSMRNAGLYLLVSLGGGLALALLGVSVAQGLA